MSLLTKSIFISNVLQNTHYNIHFYTSKYLPATFIASANQIRNYAARKGTRERRKKQKVKVEEEVKRFIPHNQRDREKYLASRPSRKFDDSWKQLPKDDVYPFKYYQWKAYDFIEAVECHRETHHPEMYNQPTAPLFLTVELNMVGEKKTRFLDNFYSLAAIPHKFDHGEERAILAFSKEPTMIEEARQAGATLAGGPELVKEFQNGNLSVHDFQFIIAHPNILPELVVLRGLMKKKFPNVKSGTLEVNIAEAVDKFKNGIQFRAVKDEIEKDFGEIKTVLGTVSGKSTNELDMDPKHLEANFSAIINSIHSFKPKREGSFITRCLLLSPPSRENFKINHSKYLKLDEVGTKEINVVDTKTKEEQQVEAVAQ